MVGADLANLANEAALLAARRDHDTVEQRDLLDALERVVLGAERKLVLSPDDRRRTACHEAGHALVGMLTAGADPVRKVSIIPRGNALGVTHAAPDQDRFNYDERSLLARLRVAAAGRAAEELVFGDLTTGAESDLRQLTELAHAMIERWGMSRELGLVAFAREPSAELMGVPVPLSESTRAEIDREVRNIVETARTGALALLADERKRLDALADALVEHETLDQPAVYRAAVLAPARRALRARPARRPPSRPRCIGIGPVHALGLDDRGTGARAPGVATCAAHSYLRRVAVPRRRHHHTRHLGAGCGRGRPGRRTRDPDAGTAAVRRP